MTLMTLQLDDAIIIRRLELLIAIQLLEIERLRLKQMRDTLLDIAYHDGV